MESAIPNSPVETVPPSIALDTALAEVAAQNTFPEVPMGADHPGTLVDSEEPQIFSNASVEATAKIFPEYINTAIVRQRHDFIGWVAAITMAFPKVDVSQAVCRASLAISYGKVEYLAMTLFKIHIEADRETYRVMIPGGAWVAATTELSLQGAHISAVREIFGSNIFAAISGTSFFREERQKAILTTACVSMGIPSKVTSQAFIYLLLDLKKAIQISGNLYTL